MLVCGSMIVTYFLPQTTIITAMMQEVCELYGHGWVPLSCKPTYGMRVIDLLARDTETDNATAAETRRQQQSS